MATAVLIVITCVAAAIGAVIGIFKKASRSSFWGATVLCSLLLAMLFNGVTKEGTAAYSYVVLIGTVVSIIVFTVLFAALKGILSKATKAKETYSGYKKADAVEENEARVLNAVDKGDKKEYRKQRRAGKKLKPSAGFVGVLDRILGAAACGLNWLVGVGMVVCPVLLFIGLSNISFFAESETIANIFSGSGWTNLGVKYALDIPVIGVIALAVKSGYKNGFFSILPAVVVICMLVGFGYASWAIAGSSACSGAVEGLKSGLLKNLPEEMESYKTLIAKVIITAIIYLLSLVVVILTGIFLSSLMAKFRDNDAFYVVDGVIGAIVSTVVIVAVFLFVGGVAYTLQDLDFMQSFNYIESKTRFADVFYSANPLNDLFDSLPIRSWFGEQ